MDKTVKQIAEELGTSKQAIQYHIKKMPKTCWYFDSKQGIKTVMVMPEGQEYIRQKVAKKDNKQQQDFTDKFADKNPVYEAVLKQLEIKDKQIAELNERLKEANKLIDQAHQLQAIAEQKIQLLEEKQVTVTGTDEGEKPGIFVSLFSKLFRSE